MRVCFFISSVTHYLTSFTLLIIPYIRYKVNRYFKTFLKNA
nr:MAG TPA: hypothetical protein [Caudoviricetes sp.]